MKPIILLTLLLLVACSPPPPERACAVDGWYVEGNEVLPIVRCWEGG